MMSEEISRVMSEQRNLEQKYAQLVQNRQNLTGIINKKQLEDNNEEIKVVAKQLKESTRTLSRVL